MHPNVDVTNADVQNVIQLFLIAGVLTTYAGQNPSTRWHRWPSETTHRFKCSYCSYSTPHKTNLITHERMHTGEKPYHCHLCPKSFAQRSNLKAHIRTHTGEKPYMCRFCPQAFNHSQHLKGHELKHSKAYNTVARYHDEHYMNS